MSSSANKHAVIVKNIAASTSDTEVKDFFSFCGKIADFSVSGSGGETKTAEVTFEKDAAMRTAVLLNNTQLGPNHISVACASGDVADDDAAKHVERDADDMDLSQEEKPRTRVIAEYMASGYVIGDAAIQRAIEVDNKHGVSSRFVNTLQNLDRKYHASDRARATNENYGISQRANNWYNGLGSYFERATNTPTGRKLVKFYSDGARQVQDIHVEARRLADLKKEEHGGSAYKASGLERVFGKEKEAQPSSTSNTAAAPTSEKTDASKA
ncbi:hypothetical protein L249_2644 [Ophiocordyceps polyrhachis-furcata BCC 54312]|uniref:RRM domain-containing protein n=1 Tax=Ophiocordyceps polyrhachis-furcata BCC 54312 TaxID=1330021 RepID=A0A367LQ14_9HYPO|nr:hypothetical protein L249_2644 [Ophiocordyceps polyrhachis-furcata BCC 54312]